MKLCGSLKIACWGLLAVTALVGPLNAQDTSGDAVEAMKAQHARLMEQIAVLESKIAALKSKTSSCDATAVACDVATSVAAADCKVTTTCTSPVAKSDCKVTTTCASPVAKSDCKVTTTCTSPAAKSDCTVTTTCTTPVASKACTVTTTCTDTVAKNTCTVAQDVTCSDAPVALTASICDPETLIAAINGKDDVWCLNGAQLANSLIVACDPEKAGQNQLIVSVAGCDPKTLAKKKGKGAIATFVPDGGGKGSNTVIGRIVDDKGRPAGEAEIVIMVESGDGDPKIIQRRIRLDNDAKGGVYKLRQKKDGARVEYGIDRIDVRNDVDVSGDIEKEIEKALKKALSGLDKEIEKAIAAAMKAKAKKKADGPFGFAIEAPKARKKKDGTATYEFKLEAPKGVDYFYSTEPKKKKKARATIYGGAPKAKAAGGMTFQALPKAVDAPPKPTAPKVMGLGGTRGGGATVRWVPSPTAPKAPQGYWSTTAPRNNCCCCPCAKGAAPRAIWFQAPPSSGAGGVMGVEIIKPGTGAPAPNPFKAYDPTTFYKKTNEFPVKAQGVLLPPAVAPQPTIAVRVKEAEL